MRASAGDYAGDSGLGDRQFSQRSAGTRAGGRGQAPTQIEFGLLGIGFLLVPEKTHPFSIFFTFLNASPRSQKFANSAVAAHSSRVLQLGAEAVIQGWGNRAPDPTWLYKSTRYWAF